MTGSPGGRTVAIAFAASALIDCSTSVERSHRVVLVGRVGIGCRVQSVETRETTGGVSNGYDTKDLWIPCEKGREYEGGLTIICKCDREGSKLP
jgi:hypothetical protein